MVALLSQGCEHWKYGKLDSSDTADADKKLLLGNTHKNKKPKRNIGRKQEGENSFFHLQSYSPPSRGPYC